MNLSSWISACCLGLAVLPAAAGDNASMNAPTQASAEPVPAGQAGIARPASPDQMPCEERHRMFHRDTGYHPYPRQQMRGYGQSYGQPGYGYRHGYDRQQTMPSQQQGQYPGGYGYAPPGYPQPYGYGAAPGYGYPAPETYQQPGYGQGAGPAYGALPDYGYQSPPGGPDYATPRHYQPTPAPAAEFPHGQRPMADMPMPYADRVQPPHPDQQFSTPEFGAPPPAPGYAAPPADLGVAPPEPGHGRQPPAGGWMPMDRAVPEALPPAGGQPPVAPEPEVMAPAAEADAAPEVQPDPSAGPASGDTPEPAAAEQET